MKEFETELENCKWADKLAENWKLIDVLSRFDDDSEILVPSSHPDSDAELEQDPVSQRCCQTLIRRFAELE